ncbi:hypothetical protein ElyMa_002179900 [Elysia marginata]|uniref:Fucolectin tachylectin-4 pentraxin-1 domain-containing protein n=1 Tax=Elysia marginata TaxID=1093978 RepID=A0AAV4FS18_9GAST|nr:hypothetical protein ElyMa_002179900 [Elysia marginata]
MKILRTYFEKFRKTERRLYECERKENEGASDIIMLRLKYSSESRNVALKQTAQQSSRYVPTEHVPLSAPDFFLAENAVDGRVGDGSRDDSRLTCTHTIYEDDPDWWTVNFTQAADVTRFLVYNRNDACCNVRLENFKLTVLSGASTDTSFTYDEPGTTRALYTVVPSPRISFPVSQVRFDLVAPEAMLTLCEVLVYGGVISYVSTIALFECLFFQLFGYSCARQVRSVNCVGGNVRLTSLTDVTDRGVIGGCQGRILYGLNIAVRGFGLYQIPLCVEEERYKVVDNFN